MSADDSTKSSKRRYALMAVEVRRQRRAAGGPLLASRRGPAVGDRAPRVGAMAHHRARGLFRQRAGEHLALAICCCDAQDVHVPSEVAAPVVSRGAVLQQLPAEQHRRRRRTHSRYGAAGGFEDAGDDGRARRSRARADGAGPRRGAGATVAARNRRVCHADLAVVALGRVSSPRSPRQRRPCSRRPGLGGCCAH